MNSLKNTLICLMVLGLFIAGMLFMYFLLQDKTAQSRMKISQAILFEKPISYTHFTSEIHLNTSDLLNTRHSLLDSEKTQIEHIFKNILDEASKDELCQKGSFNLAPAFAYKDGQKAQKGYEITGGIHCEIKQEAIQKYNTLLKNLQQIISKNNWVSLWASSLRPIIKREQYDQILEESQDSILLQANEIKSHYEKSLKQKCIIASIAFRQNHNLDISQRRDLMSVSIIENQGDLALSSGLPLDKQTQMGVVADLVFECY